MHHGQVRGVVWILKVPIERKELSGRKHALVDDDSGGQAANVEERLLRQTLVVANLPRCNFSCSIQGSLELVAI